MEKHVVKRKKRSKDIRTSVEGKSNANTRHVPPVMREGIKGITKRKKEKKTVTGR